MRVIALSCRHCSVPCAHVYNGVFSVDSRHNGHSHSNSISLRQLIELLDMTIDATTTATLAVAQGIAGYSPHDTTMTDDGKPAIILRCHRGDCDSPWAILAGGKLRLVSWHGQMKHANELSVETIRVLTLGG